LNFTALRLFFYDALIEMAHQMLSGREDLRGALLENATMRARERRKKRGDSQLIAAVVRLTTHAALKLWDKGIVNK
jgi:hypothetical protein